MTTETLEPEVDPMLGRFVGKYQIVRKLGEGGMGAVYVGQHPILKTERAIKTLKPEAAANRELASRFVGEARGAAAIKHPGIIEIEDVDRMEDGRGYIVMELLEGADCERLGNDQPQPLGLVFSVMVQALDALHAAHERGIIHRDLKPANLFVTQPEGRVKVLDFGIAKLQAADLAGDVRTSTKMVAGTLGYMAPEQARALTHVDRRADLFSMGVIFYKLVTGMRPWPADSIGDHIFHVTSTPLTAPNVYRPDLPPAWSALIVECLAAQPERRPDTARDVQLRLIASTPGPEAARIVERFVPAMLRALPGTDAAASSGGFGSPSAPVYSSGIGHGTILAGATPTVAHHARKRGWVMPSLLALGVLGGAAITVAAARWNSSKGDDAPAAASSAPVDLPDAAGSAKLAAAGPSMVDAAPVEAAAPVDAPPVDPAPVDAPPPVDAVPPPAAIDAEPSRPTVREPRPTGHGSLHVYVVPWAEVWLDGKPLGQTPVRLDNVAAGSHTLRLVGAVERETLKVTIKDKQTATVRRDWPPSP